MLSILAILEANHHNYAAAINNSIQTYSLHVSSRTFPVIWEDPNHVYTTALTIMVVVLIGGNLFLLLCVVVSRVICFVRRRRDYEMINEED
jgi:hypothetical protein